MAEVWRLILCVVLSSSYLGVSTVTRAKSLDSADSVSVDNSTDAQDNDVPLTPEDIPYHIQLDHNYDLRWNFNSTHILFQTCVKTNGYVGFGFSNNGAMFPSDVIIAWVKDGQVHFADRHAIDQSMPIIDDQQDWHLVSGTEQGDETTITMIRKLDTCDDQDLPIKTDTVRIIYSYSLTDPDSDDDIAYHGMRRGTKSVLLLNLPSSGTDEDIFPDDVFTIDFRAKNYSVPKNATTYSCTLWKLPDLGGKHHMFRYEPVITAGHELLIHHMILYYCTIPLSQTQMAHPYNCYALENPITNWCMHSFVTWGIGAEGYNYPAHVGHSFGTPDDPVYFRLEIHYNNVNKRSDLVDNSGLRLFLTKQLREYDAGSLMVGVMIDPLQIIPPHVESFSSRGYCQQGCLDEGLGDQEELHVFSIFLHAHLLGRKIRTRFFRNGTELPPLAADETYDFNYQERRRVPERVIKKGDSLLTECIYDSSQRTKATYGGFSTEEEMCISYLLYYPRTKLASCLSLMTYNLPEPKNIFPLVSRQDWTKEGVRAAFIKRVEKSTIGNICYGRKYFKFHGRVTAQPNVTIPYTPPVESSHCNG